jgi:hypothetical protein
MQTTTNALQWPGRGIRLTIITSLLFFFSLPVFCRQKTAIANAGNGWSADSNWNPFGVPANGDTVIIPAGQSIRIKGDIYPVAPCLVIRVFGSVDFDASGKLDLSSNSSLSLMAGARIESHGSSSELIKIGGILKYNGQNDGTLTGPAFANSATGSSPNGFAQGVLAIRLYTFTAQIEGQWVMLDWKASSNHEMDRFLVQKSTNAETWTDLANVPATPAGTGLSVYEYTDALSSGTSFYRLALQNAEGNISYSSTIPVGAAKTGIKIFPNPSTDHVYVSWNEMGNRPVVVEISDIRNRIIRKLNISGEDHFASIGTASIPEGIYFVTVTDGILLRRTLKLIITK